MTCLVLLRELTCACEPDLIHFIRSLVRSADSGKSLAPLFPLLPSVVHVASCKFVVTRRRRAERGGGRGEGGRVQRAGRRPRPRLARHHRAESDGKLHHERERERRRAEKEGRRGGSRLECRGTKAFYLNLGVCPLHFPLRKKSSMPILSLLTWPSSLSHE